MKVEFQPEIIKLELELWQAAILKMLFSNMAIGEQPLVADFVNRLYVRLSDLLMEFPEIIDDNNIIYIQDIPYELKVEKDLITLIETI